MKSRYVLAPMMLISLVGTASGQVLFDNGPLSTGATTGSGVAAPAGTTWSEVQGDTAACSNTTSGFTVAILAAQNFRLADDFTIPSGQTWNITAIEVYHYQTGSSPAASPFIAANLQIWNGRPGDGGAAVVFGDTTTNRLGTSVFSNMYRTFNSTGPFPTAPGTTRPIFKSQLTAATSLSAGTYWIDWQSQIAGNLTHFGPNVTVTGSPGPTGANGRQFNSATNLWADLLDTGVAAGGVGGCHSIPQAVAFRVLGTVQGGSCYANCDQSTATPALTGNDFTCFINAFAQNLPYANCDGSTGTPALTGNDFTCFINAYALGCS